MILDPRGVNHETYAKLWLYVYILWTWLYSKLLCVEFYVVSLWKTPPIWTILWEFEIMHLMTLLLVLCLYPCLIRWMLDVLIEYGLCSLKRQYMILYMLEEVCLWCKTIFWESKLIMDLMYSWCGWKSILTHTHTYAWLFHDYDNMVALIENSLS